MFQRLNSIDSLILACLLSGMYSHTTGAVDNQHSKVPDSFSIVTDLIRQAGYGIAFVGKSHVEGALMDAIGTITLGNNILG